jgi:flagellar basal-body rod protein FlgB
MSTLLDSALGLHAKALELRARRAEVLASNLANADTPGYKARDLDFKGLLDQSLQPQAVAPKLTHAAHLQGVTASPASERELLYRVPNQAALDGNTVDAHLEKAAFMENALQYQTTLQLLNRRIKGLIGAIRGE